MLDIQYNRNEEYKTIITPTQTAVVDSSTSSNTSTSATTITTTTTKKGADGCTNNGDETTQESTNSSSSSNTVISTNFNAKLSLNNDNDIETTVIFMPNVWSLMQNSIEYQQYVDLYKNLIDNPDLAPTIPLSSTNKKAVSLTNNTISPDGSTAADQNTKRKSEENGLKNESTHKALNCLIIYIFIYLFESVIFNLNEHFFFICYYLKFNKKKIFN